MFCEDVTYTNVPTQLDHLLAERIGAFDRLRRCLSLGRNKVAIHEVAEEGKIQPCSSALRLVPIEHFLPVRIMDRHDEETVVLDWVVAPDAVRDSVFDPLFFAQIEVRPRIQPSWPAPKDSHMGEMQEPASRLRRPLDGLDFFFLDSIEVLDRRDLGRSASESNQVGTRTGRPSVEGETKRGSVAIFKSICKELDIHGVLESFPRIGYDECRLERVAVVGTWAPLRIGKHGHIGG